MSKKCLGLQAITIKSDIILNKSILRHAFARLFYISIRAIYALTYLFY
jgi:hypothetical protein